MKTASKVYKDEDYEYEIEQIIDDHKIVHTDNEIF